MNSGAPMWGFFWWIVQILHYLLAPIVNPVVAAFQPLPRTIDRGQDDGEVQQETFVEALITFFVHARLPYFVFRSMRRAFQEGEDVASLDSVLLVVFRTTFNRPFDEKTNPEGREHQGSDLQEKWDMFIEEIGWWYGLPSLILVGIAGFFVCLDCFTDLIVPKDASPALLWSGRLVASSTAWSALYLATFSACRDILKGAHVGALWYTAFDGKIDLWWNLPFALALPAIYAYWNIVLSLAFLAVSISPLGNSNIESQSTVWGNFFKVWVVLYNVQALAHFVGFIGFWRMHYRLLDFWKRQLAPGRREEGLAQILERERLLRQSDEAPVPINT